MPYLLVATDVSIGPEEEQAFLANLSQRVAEALGKPQKYMMAALAPLRATYFGDRKGKSAFVELMAIGLPREKIGELALLLSDLVSRSLALEGSRVYIVFRDVAATHWAWNGKTFS
jgi:phenylpyruvate tautomerase